MNNQRHYLRFAQALVLAAAVPACSSAEDPQPKADAPATTKTSEPVAEAKPEQPDAIDAGAADAADAELPFSSGPLMPPSLPEAFA